jgi:8-oxo-dGTP diphosphatase
MLPLSSIAVLSVSGYVGTLLLGAIAGVLLDRILSPSLDRRQQRRSIHRALRRRQIFDYAGRPFEFDGVDVGIHVLFGTLGRALDAEDVQATLVDGRWRAPGHLRDAVARYAQGSGFFDGEVGRLNAMHVATLPGPYGQERHQVRLEVMPTGYFDYLATNVALGPFTPATAPLLNGRGGLAATQLSNMMGLDLTLITEDGHVPVFFRSDAMATIDRCWQSSSGETVQLRVDVDTDGRPDIFETARRGLDEELGIKRGLVNDVKLTAVVATPEYANIGLLMIATLPLTTEQFEGQFNRHVLEARDNWEYSRHDMLAVDDVDELARALTDPARSWTKQAVASIVFAHAYRANGNLRALAEAIRARGTLNLAVSGSRDVLGEPVPEAVPSRPHCWKCGTLLDEAPPTACHSCGQAHYQNPKPCGEAVVVDEDQVLLIRRAVEPWKGRWDLPGGFCDGDEHPMHAAERELHEEVGLTGRAIAYLGTWMDTYDSSAPYTAISTVNSAYLVQLEAKVQIERLQAEEVSEARWFPLSKLPNSLAFPAHLYRVLGLAAIVAAESHAGGELPDRAW